MKKICKTKGLTPPQGPFRLTIQMKIKYTRTTTFVPPLKQTKKGDWIDLTLAEDMDIPVGGFSAGSLGIRMKLPKGFEAYVIARSSTGKRYKVLVYNSIGLIDESYCGPDDVWHILLYAPQGAKIKAGTRVCQFRIMLKMQADILTKLKWLFTNKVKFVEVEDFEGKNRGGLGSTN